MNKTAEYYCVEGEEKAAYLSRLAVSLSALAQGFSLEKDDAKLVTLREFGTVNKWDWSRLPKQESASRQLSELVQRVRSEYSWFDWNVSSKDQSKNRGYFETLNISAQSGLPWVFDLIELHRLRKEAAAELAKLPTYDLLGRRYRDMLLEDYVQEADIAAKTTELHKTAMKRSFLEQLQNTELLGWEASKFSMLPKPRKVISLGGEELWNITFITHSLARGQFQLYVIDVWQDNREPQIVDNGSGEFKVSPQLTAALRFGEDNAAWYILRTIDEQFKSIHPVHVTRALLGPFENRYKTKADSIDPLPITAVLLAADLTVGLFRCSRQYTYAPNHEPYGEELRQVISKEDWRDEIIVCPAAHSSEVSRSVLGTNIRIIEM